MNAHSLLNVDLLSTYMDTTPDSSCTPDKSKKLVHVLYNWKVENSDVSVVFSNDFYMLGLFNC